MLDLLVLTIFLPLLGAGGILLLTFLLTRLDIKKGRVKVFVAAIILPIVVVASILVFGSGGGSPIALSSLYPSLLAESTVEMRWDATLWPLGLSLSVCIGCLLLGTGGRDIKAFSLAPVLLLLLSAGLAALWSANLLTTIVCWALFDLAFALGLIAAGGRRGDVIRVLAVGTGAGLLLWAGGLVAGGGIGSVQWALMPPGGTKMSFWGLAGLVRLGAYPLHLSFPRHIRSESPLVGAFYLSPVLGWGLWTRLALVSDRVFPIHPWMVTPAMLTLVVGGVLAWTADSPRESRSWIGMGGNGAVLAATVLGVVWGEGWAGQAVVPVMIFGAVGWMLGTTMLFLGGGFDLSQAFRVRTWHESIPSLIGALSLVGAPATVGFVAASGLLEAVVENGHWGAGVAFFIGQGLLVAAVVRWLLASDSTERQGSSLVGRTATTVGLTGLALSLVVVGIVPDRVFAGARLSSLFSLQSLLAAPRLVGWLLWGGTVILGGALAWGDRLLRPRIALWLDVLHDVVLLDWGYGLLMGAVEQGFGLLRVVDDVLGGRGALLWSCVILLILVLVRGG